MFASFLIKFSFTVKHVFFDVFAYYKYNIIQKLQTMFVPKFIMVGLLHSVECYKYFELKVQQRNKAIALSKITSILIVNISVPN